MVGLTNTSVNGERVVSLAMTVLLLVSTMLLYPIAGTYQGYAGRYPRLLLLVAFVSLLALLLQQTVLEYYDIQFFPSHDGNEADEVMEYFTGGESKYSPRQRVFRIGSLVLWTALFFVFGAINLLLAIAVSYTGMMLTLGVRDWKRVVGSVVAMEILVYVLFIQLLNVPLEVF